MKGTNVRKSVRYFFLVAAVLLVLSLLGSLGIAGASHANSLPGSDFEIDPDANLVVDDISAPSGRPSLDWLVGGTGTLLREGVISQEDTPSGQDDNAFGQGSKEDTAVPSVVAGGIPNNKSDLKFFGVFKERNVDGNFLHLFWTRVQDPRGTTLMDFEFNQSTTISGNGITPERTPGDLLITYELAQGGTVPSLFLYEWLGSADDGTCEASNKYPCWGNKTSLDTAGAASGSINSSFIPADETGGLSTTGLDPRTFGEASIDLDFIFDPNVCESFGSAYLKSRSSDSFTAALKDFIAPVPVNLSNCGTVIINKETDPSPDPTTTSFNFTNDLLTDPADPLVQDFDLLDGGSKTVQDVLSGSYTVTESDPSADGFTLTAIDCSASNTPDPPDTNIGTRTASFTIAAGDVVDCTFTNTLERGSIRVVKNTVGGDATFNFTSSTLGDFSLTTVGNTASTLFDELIPGTYDVAETVPDGWDLTSATCDDGSDPASIGLDPGEDVICTFVNTQQGKIIVDKITNPSGSVQSFDFALTGGPDSLNVLFSLTDGATPFDSGFIKPGTDYAVAETVPAGWTLDSATCDDGSAVSAIDLAPGETVTCTFNNSIGAIQIIKTSSKGDTPLAGATFEVKAPDGTVVATPTTDAIGQACVDGLVVGDTYTVTETAAPTGYAFNATPKPVVAAAAECGGAGTPAPVGFVNDPLSEIVITFNSLAGPVVTVATNVSCTGPSADGSEKGPLADTQSATFTDLLAGTYTCTIVVDP